MAVYFKPIPFLIFLILTAFQFSAGSDSSENIERAVMTFFKETYCLKRILEDPLFLSFSTSLMKTAKWIEVCHKSTDISSPPCDLC